MSDLCSGAQRAQVFRPALLSVAVLVTLSACGGGSNTRPDDPPTLPPVEPPPPAVVEPPNPAYAEHLRLTNAQEAIDAGYSGKGVRVGVIDTGVNRNHPALAGRVVSNLNYVDPRKNNLSVDDVDGHGTAVAQIIAGGAFGQWPGGIARDAEIVAARIINDEPPEDDGTGEGNEVNGALGLEPIHNDLISRGVKVMNNSWGGLYWTNPDATAPIAAEYRKFIHDNGGVVVFATGNVGNPDPTDTASLPSQPGRNGSTPGADLEVGWLAVAALDDEGTGLASYSNACGVAKSYCLAAAGTVVVTGTDDAHDAPEYWRWRGTSFAAPQVSGAVAMVWEAFPWFDNDLVRQTILGTARDIGDPGVDEVFGYGVLDVGKAVRGPGRFDWGRVTANFNDGTSVWSNDIAGSGGLTKRGSGTLELSGNSSYTGSTLVDGGMLRLSGSLTGSNVEIRAGGALGGGGSVSGDVVNQGTLALDAGDGFRIGGNYTHGADAVVSMVLGHGGLEVAGNADIQGGTVHIAGAKSGYVTASRERVLHAEGDISGRFDGYSYDADSVFFQGSLGYDLENVWLNISRLDVLATAAGFGTISPAALSSAQRVEAAFRAIDAQEQSGSGPVADGFIRTAGEFQRIPDQALASASLASLSGELHAAAAATTFDAVDMGRRALSTHFGEVSAQPQRAASWQRRLGGSGQGGFSGTAQSVDGWMIGRDHGFGGSGVAGFAFGEVRADSRLDGSRDRGRDRQAQGQLYAGGVYGKAYTLGQLGFGHFDRQLERHLFTGSQSRGVFSAYSGEYATINMEAGYRFGDTEATLVPYLGLEYTRIASDGFAEPGADGFGLRADAWSSRRSQAIAGLRAGREWGGVAVTGYAEWQEVLSTSGLELNASFVGVDAWSPLGALDSGRSGGLFGVGVDAWTGRNALLRFGYDQRFGPRGDARMVSLRYALGF